MIFNVSGGSSEYKIEMHENASEIYISGETSVCDTNLSQIIGLIIVDIGAYIIQFIGVNGKFITNSGSGGSSNQSGTYRISNGKLVINGFSGYNLYKGTEILLIGK